MSSADDVAEASSVAGDLWLASILARDCPSMHLNDERVTFWTKTMFFDLDNDKSTVEYLMHQAQLTALSIAVDTEFKLGLSEFCDKMLSLFGKDGTRRHDLISQAP